MSDVGKPKLLLIVEDEPSMMKMLRESLEADGFSVVQTANADQALTHASTDRPDLVLLDLMLPGESGMSFLKKLRESTWGKKMPVIILTNVSPDDRIMSAVARDEPSYYLIKAVTSMDDILAKVKATLGMQAL